MDEMERKLSKLLTDGGVCKMLMEGKTLLNSLLFSFFFGQEKIFDGKCKYLLFFFLPGLKCGH